MPPASRVDPVTEALHGVEVTDPYRWLEDGDSADVIASPVIYRGSANTAVLRVGELFREAVRHNAVSLILVHNHPSGDPTPSPEDVAVTREVVQAGKLLDIDVLDHLVIGRQRYVSLKERGLGFGA